MIAKYGEHNTILSRDIVNDIPLSWKILPWLFNRKINNIICEILNKRTHAAIHKAWLNYPVNIDVVNKINRLISTIMNWPLVCFHPDDECYILFRFWERKISDNLELECFFVELQSSISHTLPEFDNLPEIKLSQFIQGLFQIS